MSPPSKASTDGLRIIVLGYIVRGPMGGMTWHHLQYIMGLRDLGYEVYYIEDSSDMPLCYHPARDVTDSDPTSGLGYAARTFERVGLDRHWAYYDAHTARWLGPCAHRILECCAGADLLLNLSCLNPVRAWLQNIPRRALVETDPAFTQIKNLTNPDHRRMCAGHTAFFSFGGNIGNSQCTIPCDALPWQVTRQPIVMDAWP